MTNGGEAGPVSRLPSPVSPADAFEHQIFVKSDAPAVLTRTLDPLKLEGSSLVIGTSTDPYQPAERKFQLTRRILKTLLGWKGLSLGIITKSPLIARDLDLLQKLSARHDVSVNISCCSLDAALLRRLERRSPAPHARIRALRTLAKGGINTGILIAPILPGITDQRESLAALLRAAKDAGASFAWGQPLRLGAAITPQFNPVLEREFPELVARYRRHYGTGSYVTRAYKKALMHRLNELLAECGFKPEDGRRKTGDGETEPRPMEQWTFL
jgi:DNA repair photolyase